jgi:uncharacterized protein (TIGR00645 family)
MIANLLVMVIIGGYEIFVSRLHIDEHPDQPEWLDHVDAGVLKIKLGMALVSISSIHLLRSFINASNMTEHTLKWEVIIHCVLVVVGDFYCFNRLVNSRFSEQISDNRVSPINVRAVERWACATHFLAQYFT